MIKVFIGARRIALWKGLPGLLRAWPTHRRTDQRLKGRRYTYCRLLNLGFIFFCLSSYLFMARPNPFSGSRSTNHHPHQKPGMRSTWWLYLSTQTPEWTTKHHERRHRSAKKLESRPFLSYLFTRTHIRNSWCYRRSYGVQVLNRDGECPVAHLFIVVTYIAPLLLIPPTHPPTAGLTRTHGDTWKGSQQGVSSIYPHASLSKLQAERRYSPNEIDLYRNGSPRQYACSEKN